MNITTWNDYVEFLFNKASADTTYMTLVLNCRNGHLLIVSDKDGYSETGSPDSGWDLIRTTMIPTIKIQRDGGYRITQAFHTFESLDKQGKLAFKMQYTPKGALRLGYSTNPAKSREQSSNHAQAKLDSLLGNPQTEVVADEAPVVSNTENTSGF